MIRANTKGFDSSTTRICKGTKGSFERKESEKKAFNKKTTNSQQLFNPTKIPIVVQDLEKKTGNKNLQSSTTNTYTYTPVNSNRSSTIKDKSISSKINYTDTYGGDFTTRSHNKSPKDKLMNSKKGSSSILSSSSTRSTTSINYNYFGNGPHVCPTESRETVLKKEARAGRLDTHLPVPSSKLPEKEKNSDKTKSSWTTRYSQELAFMNKIEYQNKSKNNTTNTSNSSSEIDRKVKCENGPLKSPSNYHSRSKQNYFLEKSTTSGPFGKKSFNKNSGADNENKNRNSGRDSNGNSPVGGCLLGCLEICSIS